MTSRFRSRGVVAAAFLFPLLASCGREAPAPATTGPQTVVVRDDLERAVTVPARIGRVVTLAPNLTEMLFAIGAGDRIVGTDDFSDFPPKEVQTLPRVGGMQPDIEKITALRPDLVLASTSGNHPNLAAALANARIPLYVVRTDRLEEIPVAMSRIASLLHVDAGGRIERLRAEIQQRRRQRSRAPRVLYAVWTDPLYVGGRETFADDLIVLTGAKNAVQVHGWPQYSLESLVAAPPDLIVYPQRSVTPQQIEALFARAPILRGKTVAAPLDENLFTRPGPRVAEAAEALNQVLDKSGF